MRIGPLGVWELLIILVVVLLLFGPRRLPEMAKGIGQSVREFRKGIRDIRDDIDKDEPGRQSTVTVAKDPAAPPPETPGSAVPTSHAVPEAPTQPVQAVQPDADEAERSEAKSV